VAEQFADVGRGITLCYETFGDPADPPLLLIMGLGTQMLGWHEDWCAELASRGFHVIRYDNRDNGRSTHVHGRPPTLAQLVHHRFGPDQYRLTDLAADAAGLIDALGVGPVHAVGASMGGMIAQTLAAEHPERVRSLVSIMSTTGHRFKGQPAFGVYPTFVQRPEHDREAYAERAVRLFAMVGSPGFPRDDDRVRDLALRSFERDYSPAGTGRQLAAILASGDRTAQLRTIRVPTLVIHGTADRLVRPSGGRATAAAIPGARLMLVEGMGHDLPRGAWPRLIGAIAEHAREAQGTPREEAWSSS
jgi:pimeloyl-ACP methyl ester carboxylesterase